MHNKSSATTYVINNYQYRPIRNFTIVIGFSAVWPRPIINCTVSLYILIKQIHFYSLKSLYTDQSSYKVLKYSDHHRRSCHFSQHSRCEHVCTAVTYHISTCKTCKHVILYLRLPLFFNILGQVNSVFVYLSVCFCRVKIITSIGLAIGMHVNIPGHGCTYCSYDSQKWCHWVTGLEFWPCYLTC